MNYTAPNGGAYPLYDRLMEQTHVLIAGTTGSGKSVTENGLIYNIVNKYSPDEAELYLIDPKLLELDAWRVLPHVKGYAETPEDTLDILNEVYDRMMQRYEMMKRHGVKMWWGSHIYVFFDEMARSMRTGDKEYEKTLESILVLGRAARIHIIGCSQFAKKACIPATIIDNFTCNVGLKMRDKVASRQIIGKAGCEELKTPGSAIIALDNGDYEEVQFPMYTEAHYAAMRNYYSAQRFSLYRNQAGGR